MRKLIQTIFNREKYIQDRKKELNNILFERYGVNNLEEFENTMSHSPLIAVSNPISDFPELRGNFAPRGKSWEQMFSEKMNEEIDKRLKKEDYEEINEYPLLNVVLDGDYNFIYIVLLEDGTPKQLWQKDGGEYKIIDK